MDSWWSSDATGLTGVICTQVFHFRPYRAVQIQILVSSRTSSNLLVFCLMIPLKSERQLTSTENRVKEKGEKQDGGEEWSTGKKKKGGASSDSRAGFIFLTPLRRSECGQTEHGLAGGQKKGRQTMRRQSWGGQG